MKNLKKLLIVLCMSLLALGLTACGGGTKVDVSPFITVSYQGFGDNITAHFDFSYRNLEEAIMTQWDEDASWEKLGELTMLEGTMELDKYYAEGLKAGDKVTVTLQYNEEKAEKAGYQFVGTEKTFEVGEITAEHVVDPFDPEFFGPGKMVDVQLSGLSPEAKLFVNNQAPAEDPYSKVSYTWEFADPAQVPESMVVAELRNGDRILITASLSKNVTDTQLTQSQMEMTIADLPEKVTDITKLNDADLAQLQEIIQKEVNEAAERSFAIYFQGDQGENFNYAFSGDEIGTLSDITLTDYAFSLTEHTVIFDPCAFVPFYFSAENCIGRGSCGSEYFEDEETLSFDNIYGYAVVSGLVMDAEGKIISDEINVRIGDYGRFYLDEENFLASFNSQFSSEEMPQRVEFQ